MMSTTNIQHLCFALKRVLACKRRHFWQDQSAVSAIEFAMIMPFMLLLFVGSIEVTGILNQDRKVSRIANSVTDLVAQAQTVSSAEVNALFDIGGKLLAPYSDSSLDIVVASVSFDEDGDASIDWSECKSSCSGWGAGEVPPITLPGTIATPNSSIVVSQATLTYTPQFSGFFTKYFERATSYELSDTYYLRPRLTDTVECDDC